MSGDNLLAVLVGVVMVIGLAGTLLPILPGLPVIWGAALVYGLASGFRVQGVAAMVAISIAGVVGLGASVYLPQRSASSVGVPWWGQAIATLLAVIGLFVIPIVGAPLGFAVGILATMALVRRDLRDGWQATAVAIRAMLLASAIQLAAGGAMVAIWLAWVILG